MALAELSVAHERLVCPHCRHAFGGEPACPGCHFEPSQVRHGSRALPVLIDEATSIVEVGRLLDTGASSEVPRSTGRRINLLVARLTHPANAALLQKQMVYFLGVSPLSSIAVDPTSPTLP